MVADTQPRSGASARTEPVTDSAAAAAPSSSSSSSTTTNMAASMPSGLPISMSPSSGQDGSTGSSPERLYSQYDIAQPVNAAGVKEAGRYRSLRSALQSQIRGHVLHREDMPPSSPPAAAAGSSMAAMASRLETFASSTRIFNSAAPVAAQLVALPQCTEDVVAILKFCNAHSLSPSIKSGGYATAGWSVQGDIVIDLSRMNSIDVVRPKDFYAEKRKRRKQKSRGVDQPSSDGLSTARTRKADEAFSTEAAISGIAGARDSMCEPTSLEQARKRLSPTFLGPTSALNSPALRRVAAESASIGSGVRSETGSTATSQGDTTTASSVTDATSENESMSSADARMPSPSSAPGTKVEGLGGANAETSSVSSSSSAPAVPSQSSESSSTPSLASTATSALPPRRNSARSGTASVQGLRTGFAEHLSWQRHHRPDGRASTHERVVLPESGGFVWRADAMGGSGPGSLDVLPPQASSSALPSPATEMSNLAHDQPPAFSSSGQQHSTTFPLTGPPSAFHASRAPSALLPTHSHEQPWQEARFRQQIEESALHHRRMVTGAVPSQTGMVMPSAGRSSGRNSSAGLESVAGPSTSSSPSMAAAAAAVTGFGPMPTGLASFLPPYNRSPDALEGQAQQYQQTGSTSPVALRPGIYTRPYLLAVFGPGVGVRALDLATDEAGRMNTWDRSSWPQTLGPSNGEGPDDDSAMLVDGDDTLIPDGEGEGAASDVVDEPIVEDWDEPIRSTPYHCPLSAYPVGSTAMTTGGFGYISRAYGLSLDNLVEVELVLADGRVMVLNEGSKKRSQEEADLWWAVRGAAPCFGVVTRIVAKAYPIPSCFSGNLIYPFNPATAPSLIKHWRDCLKGVLPREMYTNLILVAGPNPSAHVIMIQVCLLQSASEGETFVQALSSWTGERMLLKDIEERPFLAQQDGVAQVLKGGGGRRWMIRGDTLETLTDELISQSVQRFKSATANRGVWLFELVNGAIADNAVEEDEDPQRAEDVAVSAPGNVAMGRLASTTSHPSNGRFTIPPTPAQPSSSSDGQRITKETCLAPSLRRAQFMVGALQQWEDRDEDRPCVVSVDHWLRDAVSPVSIGGPLPSFLERSETRERIASTFGEANLERLCRIKRAVDPQGLFRHTFAAGLVRAAGVGGARGGEEGHELVAVVRGEGGASSTSAAVAAAALADAKVPTRID